MIEDVINLLESDEINMSTGPIVMSYLYCCKQNDHFSEITKIKHKFSHTIRILGYDQDAFTISITQTGNDYFILGISCKTRLIIHAQPKQLSQEILDCYEKIK